MNILKTSLIAMILAAPATAEPEIAGVRAPYESRTILNTIEELNLWLDAYTDLPRSAVPLARVELVAPGSEVFYEGQMTQIGDTVRGLYDGDTATIYLVRQWYGESSTPCRRSAAARRKSEAMPRRTMTPPSSPGASRKR